MRLAATQVRELITHSAKDVRNEAIEYFVRPASLDVNVTRQLIRAVGLYGKETLPYYSHVLSTLAHDEDTIRWMIEQRRSLGRSKSAPENYADEYDLSRGIESAWLKMDARLLLPHEAEIVELLRPDDARKLRARLEPLGLPAEALWKQLEQECERLDQTPSDGWNPQQADGLTQALANFPEFVAERVLPRLADVIHQNKCIDLFVVRLAGLLKLEAAVEPLAEILPWSLQEEDDYLLVEAEVALQHLASDALFEPLVARFDAGDPYFQASVASILEAVHSDRTVALGVEWLREYDVEFGHYFAHMALAQFASDSIEPVCAWLRAHEQERDPEWNGVRSQVLTMCRVLNAAIPELEAWTEDARHDREFNRLWYQSCMADRRRQEELAEDTDDVLDEYADPWDDAPPANTIVRDAATVGRNDPCPCGSGKKFKKCCLHKPSIL